MRSRIPCAKVARADPDRPINLSQKPVVLEMVQVARAPEQWGVLLGSSTAYFGGQTGVSVPFGSGLGVAITNSWLSIAAALVPLAAATITAAIGLTMSPAA